MLLVCDQNDADNTPVFQLLVNKARTASRPSLQGSQPFCEQARGVQEAGRGHSQAGDPDCPKSCSMPCGIMISTKMGEESGSGRLALFCSASGWASIYLEVVGHLFCFVFFLSSPTSLSLTKQFLS